MNTHKPVKVYVPVEVSFEETGQMWPKVITWEDGIKYRIDRVSDVLPAPAMRGGGQGDRYTVWIRGKQSYLFFERFNAVSGIIPGRWFVERK